MPTHIDRSIRRGGWILVVAATLATPAPAQELQFSGGIVGGVGHGVNEKEIPFVGWDPLVQPPGGGGGIIDVDGAGVFPRLTPPTLETLSVPQFLPETPGGMPGFEMPPLPGLVSATVPEPSSLALLAGLLVVGARRR
jgi:hypothetical protein